MTGVDFQNGHARFFPTVCFQMCPQAACLKGCKMTQAAFVGLFSHVFSKCLHKKMHSYTGCICLTFLHCVVSNEASVRLDQSTHIVTLVAFVWLFPTVYFQVFPQTVCTRAYIITLDAFVWLFSAICLSHWDLIGCVLPKSRCWKFRFISRSLLALSIFFSNWYVNRLWIGRIEIYIYI